MCVCVCRVCVVVEVGWLTQGLLLTHQSTQTKRLIPNTIGALITWLCPRGPAPHCPPPPPPTGAAHLHCQPPPPTEAEAARHYYCQEVPRCRHAGLPRPKAVILNPAVITGRRADGQKVSRTTTTMIELWKGTTRGRRGCWATQSSTSSWTPSAGQSRSTPENLGNIEIINLRK